MGRRGATTFRAVTSRGGGLTPTRVSQRPFKPVGGPYSAGTAKITGRSGKMFRATITGMGEGANSVLLPPREVPKSRGGTGRG